MKRHRIKKTRYGKKGTMVVIAGIISLMILMGVLIGSIFYFRYQIKESSDVLKESDYKNYSNYYVMITDNSKSSFWKSVYEGAEAAAEQSDAYVEMLGNNLSVEYSKEELMEIAINSKVDGIILQADESNSMTRSIEKAEQANIPVITVLEDNSAGGRQSFVGISNYNLGEEYGKLVCQLSEKKSTVNALLLMDEEQSDSNQSIVLTGIRDAIEEVGMGDKVEVVAAPVNNSSTFAAEESIHNIFMTSTTLPDIIICLNEQNTTCVYQAVVDYNKVGLVEILGYYVSETILSAIKKNIIYSTITINTKEMGNLCTNALNEYKESGYVSDYFVVDTSLISAESLKNIGVEDAEQENN